MGAAAAAIGVQAAGSIIGGVFAAQGEKNEGLARQGYFELLASQAEGQAELVTLLGEKQSRAIQDSAAKNFTRFKRNIKRQKGAATAAIAAQGISGSATAEDIVRDAAESERLDELAIRFNADSQSDEVLQSARLRAVEFRSSAIQSRIAGESARRIGRERRTATLLSTATSTLFQIGGSVAKLKASQAQDTSTQRSIAQPRRKRLLTGPRTTRRSLLR